MVNTLNQNIYKPGYHSHDDGEVIDFTSAVKDKLDTKTPRPGKSLVKIEVEKPERKSNSQVRNSMVNSSHDSNLVKYIHQAREKQGTVEDHQ